MQRKIVRFKTLILKCPFQRALNRRQAIDRRQMALNGRRVERGDVSSFVKNVALR